MQNCNYPPALWCCAVEVSSGANSNHGWTPTQGANHNVEGGDVYVWYRPLDCAVWPNYLVKLFQPRSVTTIDLGYVAYCYVPKNIPNLTDLSPFWTQGSWLIPPSSPTHPFLLVLTLFRPTPLRITPGYLSTLTSPGTRWSSVAHPFTPCHILTCPPSAVIFCLNHRNLFQPPPV